LGVVLGSLSASNFFDGSYRLLKCSNDKYNPICLKQRKSILSREEIIKLLSILKPEKDTVRDIIISLNVIHNRLGPLSNDFTDSYKKILSHFDFHKSRELSLNEIFKLLGHGNITKFKSLLRRVLLSSEKGAESAFMFGWPRYYATTPDSFIQFLTMDKYNRTNLPLDFQAIDKILKRKNLECSGNRDGRSFKLKIKEVFDEYMMAIKLGDRDDYLKESIEKAVLIQLTSSTCPMLAKTNIKVQRPFKGIFIETGYDFNLLHFIDVMNEVIGDHYEIVKFILTVLDIEKENNLFEILASPVSISLLDLVKKINKTSPLFLETLYKGILQFEYEEYLHLVNMAEKINPVIGPFISKAWRFFNEREKNFTFHFLDSHFSESVEFKILSDFYVRLISENEDELNSLVSYFFSPRNIEKTLNSFEKISESFKGQSNLNDFRSFFSREHLLKVLEILMEGLPKEIKLEKSAPPVIGLNKMIYDNLIDSLDNYNLDIVFKKSSLKNIVLLRCLKNITDQKVDFYDFSSRFQTYCSGVKSENFLFKIVIWLDTVSRDFRNLKGPRIGLYRDNSNEVFRYPNGKQIGLFDEKGLLSPSLFQSWLSLFSVLEREYGMDSLLEGISKFIFRDEPLLLENLKELIVFMSEFDESTNQKFLSHRNELLRELSDPENFSRIKRFLNNIGQLFQDYGKWVGSSDYHQVLSYIYPQVEKRLECENFLVNDHGHRPCVDKEEAKKSISEFIKLILKKYDSKSVSALEFLIKGVSPDYKIKIPVLNDKGQEYHFSIRDVFRTFYNLTDPSFDINQRYYPIIPPDTRNAYKYYKYFKKKKNKKIPKSFVKKFNSLERVEHILRNYGFDNYNTLVSLSNGTAHNIMGHDHLDKNLKMLELCTIMRYCGKFLNSNERIKSFNALMVSDVFYDIEDYDKFKSGKTIAAIVSSSVVSSSQLAQKERLIYFDKHLNQHNAELLWKMGQMSVGSHIARFIHDRVGRTRKDFEGFIERKDFKLLNNYFLKGFPLVETQKAFTDITSELLKQDSKNRNLLNILIDAISDTSYSDLRLFEDTLANLLSVSGHLGPLNQMIEFKGLHKAEYEKLYEKNNLFPILESAPNLLRYWPILYDYWPKNVKGIEIIKNLNAFLKFIKNNLSNNDHTTYEVLNDLFLILNKVLYEEKNGQKGIDIILPILDNQRSIGQVMGFVDYFINLFKRLNYKSGVVTGERFVSLGKKITFLTENNEIDMSPLRKYIELSTHKNICFDSNQGHCILNFHYDGPFGLFVYLGKNNNLKNLFNTLFKRDMSALSKFSKKILSKISIRRTDE